MTAAEDPQYGYVPEDPAASGGQTDDAKLIVEFPSGSTARVLTIDEVDFFCKSRDKYLGENRFTENTDLQDLDRLLGLELMNFRWTQWSMSGMDYDQTLVDESTMRRAIKDATESINKLKEQMALSKKARDSKASSVEERWVDLLKRAKVFGIHRETQLTAALRLMNELSAIVLTFDRSDEQERRKLGFETPEDILEWVRETMLPEFRQVDDHFRANVQQYWKQS